ncbi:MAG: OadG family protein [Prevotella sp.]|jgi:oxaloacetate decarboxylase gamma subunit|nr:OadG family protein [Prevotella sp.]
MNTGITLMIVGMTTVFAVLLIIICLSNVLISIVNRIAPAEAEKVKAPAAPRPISPEVMEVISLTVSKITGGKGKVAQVTEA